MTQQTILSRLMGEMIKYDSGDVKLIQHLVKASSIWLKYTILHALSVLPKA